MDAETDEGMDYTGCSPGAASSESSTMDRSCSSTPVGNESTAAGEWQAWPCQLGPCFPGPALLSLPWDRRSNGLRGRDGVQENSCTALVTEAPPDALPPTSRSLQFP